MNNTHQPICERCHLTQRDPRLKVVIGLLSSTFREPVRICELARIAGMEPSELSHLFKDSLGISPKRLQTILRIGFTLSDLIVADAQIKCMAGDAGLPVVETFIRSFEKLCGLPPNEFRHLLQEIEAGIGTETAEAPPTSLTASTSGPA